MPNSLIIVASGAMDKASADWSGEQEHQSDEGQRPTNNDERSQLHETEVLKSHYF